MSKYIDAEAVMVELEKEVDLADDWKTAHEIANVVKYFPAADVVEVVRCGECKHNIQGYCEYWGDRFHHWEECDLIDENGFCHKGEKVG